MHLSCVMLDTASNRSAAAAAAVVRGGQTGSEGPRPFDPCWTATRRIAVRVWPAAVCLLHGWPVSRTSASQEKRRGVCLCGSGCVGGETPRASASARALRLLLLLLLPLARSIRRTGAHVARERCRDGPETNQKTRAMNQARQVRARFRKVPGSARCPVRKLRGYVRRPVRKV